MKIDLDIPQEDSQLFFDIVDALESDKKAVLANIKGVVRPFLEREKMFPGSLRSKFQENFENYVLNELKHFIMDRFNIDIEKASILMDREILDMIGVLPYYLQKENYK